MKFIALLLLSCTLLLASCALVPGYGLAATATTPYGDLTYHAPRALPVGFAKEGK